MFGGLFYQRSKEMEFGWINLFGAGIVAIMLGPNIIFALREKGNGGACACRLLCWLEQIGRYACLILMWLPLFVWKFGFSGAAGLLLYLIGNSGLLLAYLILWLFYFRKKTRGIALALALIPVLIFLLSGLLLRHWALVFAALLFGAGHLCITVKNMR